MASFTYNLTGLQQRIHGLTELNVDYPISTDDEYTLRTLLINKWISNWELEEGILWNQLWALASFASTSATSYSLVSSVSDMRFPGGFVELVDSGGSSTYWDVIKPEEVRLRTNNSTAWDYQYTNSQTKWCYFLGDPQAGFTLYFNPNYYPGTGTIKFPYYKKATILSSASDKPEMSDPDYIIHGVVSDLLAQEDPAESDRNFQIAQAKIRAMKTTNFMTPYWQSNRVEDRLGHLGGAGFGK